MIQIVNRYRFIMFTDLIYRRFSLPLKENGSTALLKKWSAIDILQKSNA